MSLIPVLPTALIDKIDAPVPLLVGITDRQFEQVTDRVFTLSERNRKVWVDCNNGQVQWPAFQEIDTFDFKHLNERIEQASLRKRPEQRANEICKAVRESIRS